MPSAKTRLIIRHRWALGDTTLLTALVRDIHRAYPGQYEIKVDTNWSNVWWHNPYVTQFEEKALPRPLKVQVSWGDAMKWNAYACIKGRKEMRHILAWYHYDFEQQTGIHVPVTEPKPDLHLSPEELVPRLQGRYWVIVAGGKLDMTTKHWHAHRAQEVVDKLNDQGIHCVQVGAVHTNHVHPPLQGVTNLVGQTENVRDLWNIIRYSEGVICGITGAMHIAAAFERPCVVYAGGREEPWFEGYVDAFEAFGPTAQPVAMPHRYLHTIGLLECCDVQGCWKKRTIPLDPQDLNRKAHLMCRQPVRPAHSHPVSRCQDLITSDHVVEAVMDYYRKELLPPITPAEASSEPTEAQNTELKPAGIEIPKVELVKVRQGTAVSNQPAAAPTVQVRRTPSVESRTQKPYQQVQPQELTRPQPRPVKRKLAIMDDPIIGGKITICVLCYGPHTELAKKCLNGILATLPPERLDLRVATNQVPPATIDYLKTLPITKRYVNSENRHKYPVMREMFWDPQRPIETNYMIWFDDDTWIVQPQWIDNLCQTIVDNHHYGYRMYGNLMYHDLSIYTKGGHRPDRWFRDGGWHRGRNFRARGGRRETPNGSVIDFAVGWCWAIETKAMQDANIPDPRLDHNGGDITIGEQIHQAGYAIKQWNRGKSLVACPSRESGGRRGFSQRFPWDSEA